MSLRSRVLGRVPIAFLVLVIALASSALFAQEPATPKIDVFAGYSWFNPGVSVNGVDLKSDPRGFAAAATYNFSKYAGLTLDGAYHTSAHNGSIGDNSIGTLMVGPRFIWREEHFQPFVQALAGIEFMSLPVYGITKKDVALATGGGIDIPITHRISWRMIEAQFVWGHHNLYPVTPTRNQDTNSADLRTGIVFNFGGAPPLPPMAMSCTAASPAEVMAGEPVSVTANVTNVPPKKTVTYEWKTSGGKITGTGETVQVDTTGLAPGQYTVTASGSVPKPPKDQGPLMCNAQFTVKEPPKHPPTIACTANPTTVQAGQTSEITCNVGNPDNRPLTYNHTATGGRVTPNGPNATLDTAGASAGPITVTSTVTDDRGLSANTTTTVNVEVPPPPPQASSIGTCEFNKDKRRPWRVDNACKAVLDEVALRLQRDADAKLVIVGHGDPATDKKHAAQYAAERAVNSKEYLTSGEAKQQIDPTRIETRVGAQGSQTAEFWIVPAGATFNQAETQPVNENEFKHPARRPMRHHRRR